MGIADPMTIFYIRRVWWLAVLFTVLFPVAAVQAHTDLLSTQDVLALERGSPAQQVESWLLRDDVTAELIALGVDPEMARLRVAALSPDELEVMANQIETLPAGGGVIAVLGITFLVLIVLDVIGVINIFNR